MIIFTTPLIHLSSNYHQSHPSPHKQTKPSRRVACIKKFTEAQLCTHAQANTRAFHSHRPAVGTNKTLPFFQGNPRTPVFRPRSVQGSRARPQDLLALTQSAVLEARADSHLTSERPDVRVTVERARVLAFLLLVFPFLRSLGRGAA